LLEGECNTFILSAQRDGEGSNPLSLSEKNMNKYLRKKLRLLIEFKRFWRNPSGETGNRQILYSNSGKRGRRGRWFSGL